MDGEPAVLLSGKQLEKIAEDAKDFAFTRGMVMKSRKDLPYSHSVTFVPFALLPSPFPREQFNILYDLQKDMNIVYYRVTNDYEFLKESLKKTLEADEWTRKLWQIYEKTRACQLEVPSLAILRSDYMVGQDGNAKQVEVNTMSASFGGLSTITRELHQMVLGNLRRNETIPENKAENIARALAEAWKVYQKLHNAPNAVICFAVEDVVYNTYDQRHLERFLVEKFKIPPNLIVRKTNADFVEISTEENGPLVVDGQEVAVVYMRTWYDTWQLPTEKHWQAREAVERSRSIKCPNLAWHLAGCKKIQQELAQPGVLEKFCDDNNQATRIRKVFVGLHALEDDQYYKKILDAPEKYVIKPQREGGGHNIYANDIPKFLEDLPEHHRKEYIAMELIDTFSSKNYLVNKEKVISTDVVSELGVFGYVLGSTKELIANEVDCGWIFRTKDKHCKEGGVAAGFGHLDSPRLV